MRPLGSIGPEQGYKDYVAELEATVARRDTAPDSANHAEAELISLRDPRFQRIARTFFHEHQECSGPEAVRRSRAALAFCLMDMEHIIGGPYPDALPTVAHWRRAIHLVQTTPPFDSRYYGTRIRTNLGTPMPQRYAARRFITRVVGHQLRMRPTLVDIGCSDNSGNLQDYLANREGFEFERFSIVERRAGELVVDEFKSNIFAKVNMGPSKLHRVVGVDERDPTTEENKRWDRACITPEEMKARRWDRLHDRLLMADVDKSKVDFWLGSMPKDADALLEAEGPFDAVSFVVSWYQISAKWRQKALGVAINQLAIPAKGKRRGQVMVLDFARRTNGRTHLMPLRQWTELNAFLWNGEEFKRVMVMTNGRARQGRVLPDMLPFAQGGPYETEVKTLIS